ncbi:MAG: class I SAM-dependent methyltransferase [Candidatus Neomarinimicrobiota bacterium]
MDCCQCEGYGKFFNSKIAARELRTYRKKGPTGTTKVLVDALQEETVQDLTLLDIGGGVGVLQHELLKAGVGSITGVDASAAYLAEAKGEMERRGLQDRVSYTHGDFVDVASEVPEADIVTLDRVICCYPHMNDLVSLSSAKARKFYGVVYPRDIWWMNMARPVINLYPWLLRNPFRMFIHATQLVDKAVRGNGFAPRFHSNNGGWQVAVYAR